MKTLNKLSFIQIGQYELIGGEVACEYHVKRTERLPLVYAFVVDNKIMYIGKTVQGYSRPLSYHKNPVMKKVQKGIVETCKSGGKAIVLVKSQGLTSTYQGLTLNLIEAIEQALIQKYKPKWNNYIQKE